MALLALALAAVAAAQAPQPPVPMFTLHRVAPSVWAAIAGPRSKAGANAGFVVGRRAILVVDTFENVEAAQQLLAAIHGISPLPIRYVVNTHYHIDHVTGNGVFAAAGATIMAQTNVRRWARTDNLKFFGPNPTAAQRAWVAGITLPEITYDRGVNIYLGGIMAEVRYRPGHTGGDSVVTIPAANVVFTGDMLWNHMLPNLIDASTAPLIATLDGFLRDHPRAVFIPGHGEVAHAAEVKAMRDFLAVLRADVGRAEHAGKTEAALTDEVMAELKPVYGDWGLWSYFAPRDIALTTEELRGTKPLPH